MSIQDSKRKIGHDPADVFHAGREDTANIFLMAGADGAWKAVTHPANTLASGALLTSEGAYPAELFYLRLDINGSSIMEMDTCADRETLLESLNWIGQCGHSIVSLWDFDEDRSMSPELTDIFHAAWERRCAQVQKAADEMAAAFPGDDIPEKEKPSLADQIQSAGKRITNSGSDHDMKHTAVER